MQPPNQTQLTDLLRGYHPLIGVRLNLVVDSNQSVAGKTGSSDDLSNPADRALLIELRRQSDAIVTSGATVRAENLRASKLAPIFVLTKGSSVAGFERILAGEGYQPVTLLVDSEGEAKLLDLLLGAGLKADCVALENLEPKTVLEFLRSKGFERILLEFGPSLISRWSTAGLIDEICLTTVGPTAGGLPRNFVAGNFERVSEVFIDSTKSRFERYRLSTASE